MDSNNNFLKLPSISEVNTSITPSSGLPVFNFSNNQQYVDEQAKILHNFRIALEIKQIRVRYLELERNEKMHQSSIRLNDLLVKHLEKGEYEKALQIKKILNCQDQDTLPIEEAESGYESENMNSEYLIDNFVHNVNEKNLDTTEKIDRNPSETNDSEILLLDSPSHNSQVLDEENSQLVDTEANHFSEQKESLCQSGKKYHVYDNTTYFVTCSTDRQFHAKMNILYKTEKFECSTGRLDKYECDIKGLHYHLIVRFGCKYHLSYMYKRLNLPHIKVSIVNNPKIVEFLIKKYNMKKN
ncbi:unnamed protein product [Brachionus calyciflorus]|uniref:Uncharacterized protein n=1 Tax=Brachionus calyciflorus TaxID=104777 RepID=A0A813PFW2_9BILA|nr:unnamed protein product [Brachionus calyciflorus]